MFASIAVTRMAAIGILLCTTLAWPQSQRDMVCQGSCGGGCGPCPNTSGGYRGSRSNPPAAPSAAEIAARQAYDLDEQGVQAFRRGDWVTAEAFFKQSLEKGPNDPVVLKNLAHAQSQAGGDAYKAGDYSKALDYFQQALANDPVTDPNNHIIHENLDAAKTKVAEVQREAQREGEQRRQDESAANNLRQSIQGLAQSLKVAPSPVDLDFNDGESTTPATAGNNGNKRGLDFADSNASLRDAVNDSPSDQEVAAGPMGSKIAKPNLTPADRAGVQGSDTKAGDQLLSAEATARENGDLTINYDRGGAKSSGSLRVPANSSVNPATFPAKVKNDPRMILVLKELGVLQAKRTQLDNEIKQLIAQRNSAKDPHTMEELTKQVDQKNNDYQATMLAITKGEQTVMKTKRRIETEVENPKGAPPAKQ